MMPYCEHQNICKHAVKLLCSFCFLNYNWEENTGPKMFIYFFVNSDPNLYQTYALTLNLTPNLTLTLTSIKTRVSNRFK